MLFFNTLVTLSEIITILWFVLKSKPMKNKKISISLPQGLSVRTKNYMNEVVEELNDKGVLKPIDQAMLVSLALSYEVMLKSGAELVKSGVLKTNNQGEEVSNSAQVAFFKGVNSLASIASEYGLTPKSRANIESLQEEHEEKSPLDDIIAKGMMRIAK